MFRRLTLVLAAIILPCFILTPNVAAVDVVNKDVCERFKNATPEQTPAVCKDNKGTAQNPLFGPKGILTSVINLLSVVTGVIALIIIMLAGLKFITSSTNPQDVNNARERVIYAGIALVIAATAQLMVQFVLGKIG